MTHVCDLDSEVPDAVLTRDTSSVSRPSHCSVLGAETSSGDDPSAIDAESSMLAMRREVAVISDGLQGLRESYERVDFNSVTELTEKLDSMASAFRADINSACQKVKPPRQQSSLFFVTESS